MGVLQQSAHFYGLCLARLKCIPITIKVPNFLAVGIQYLGEEAEGAGLRVLILHLRLGVHRHLLACNIIISTINIGTCCLEIVVEWQGLVELVGDVEEHVLRDAAVVGVEVLVVPLVALSRGSFVIIPGIVNTYGDNVPPLNNIRCKVEAARHHAVLGESHLLTVEPDVGAEAHALKLDEILAVAHFLNVEVLAVPHDGVGVVLDGNLEGLLLVEGSGQGYLLPSLVVEVGRLSSLEVAHFEQPTAVEVEFGSLHGICSGESYECQQNQ